MVTTEGFQRIFPGPKPHIKPASSGYQLDFTGVADRIEILEEPLFLATPLEPNNWGRWVSSVIPKVAHFRQYGANRKLLCHNGLPWQRALLDYLGLRNDQIVSHDPGKTFLCHNLMSVEYSVTNMTVSQREVELFTAMRSQAQSRQRDGAARAPSGDRVFISRLTYSSKHTSYRVLQNESELAVRLRSLGFDVIEPEMLDFDEQILAFSNASIVVCLGGAALYNAVFCAPGTSFVTIESSDYFLGPHCNLLSSLQLRHGIIVGTQDLSDPSPVHKRWSVDVDAVCQRIVAFGRL
jgi:capsular polysaccharide biosynthesis protein